MSNREFVMLAHTFNPSKHNIKGWYASEKLDGMRCLWDGGITRGKSTKEIPWANPTQVEIATGLWSRYGHPIHAPSWWLDYLPVAVPLDGELFTNRGEFQTIMSIVRRDVADERWQKVKYKVFDSPSLGVLSTSGKINNPNFKLIVDGNACQEFLRKHSTASNRLRQFKESITVLNNLRSNEVLRIMSQTPLSVTDPQSHMIELLDDVTSKGGEGLILRDPSSFWDVHRSKSLLKVKKLSDSEGTIIGYVWGQGKYENMLGALVINWNGKQFNLSGMTDAERMMQGSGPPGTVVATNIESAFFKRGCRITFRYRELSDDGIPKEARYLRKAI